MDVEELMHGEDWDGRSLTGWTTSEKLDGVRVLWTGSRLETRTGNIVRAPAEFTADLPTLPLDCELFCRGLTLQQISAAAVHGKWHLGLKLNVFDAPTDDGVWVARIATAQEAIAKCRYATIIPYSRIKNTLEALMLAEALIRNGGEGLMVRHYADRYRPGRTQTLLKIKAAQLHLAAV